MYKRVLASIITLLSVSAVLFGCSDSSKPAAVYVSIDECSNHRIIKKINVSGVVEAENDGIYTVSTKLNSYLVKSVNVQSGDDVSEGDVICEFDTAGIENDIKVIEEKLKNNQSRDEQSISTLRTKISRLERLLAVKLEQIEKNRKYDESMYNEVEQNLNTSKSELETAENEYKTACDALADADVNDKEYYLSYCESFLQTISTKRTEMETYSLLISDLRTKLDDYPYQEQIAKLEAEKEIAEINLSIDSYQSESDLQEQLNELKEALGNSVVYAPCSGTVKDVNISSGQIGKSSSLVTIVQLDKTVVHASLNDYDSILVKEGMKADITVGADKITGEVISVSRIKGVDGFDVYIDTYDSENLNIGMTVTSSIRLFDEEVLSINRNALYSDNEVYYVYTAVPQSDGTYIAEYKSVTIGAEDDENVEICSGINNGDFVILADAEDVEPISDGMCVKVISSSDAD